METNPPDTPSKTSNSGNLRITKTFSFKKKIRIGNLARKVLKWGLFLGVPLIIISFVSYYFLIFLSSKAILVRSIKNLKKVESLKYTMDVNLDFSNTFGSGTSREFSAESNILKVNEPASYKILGEGSIKSVGGNLESDSSFRISLNGNEITKVNLINSEEKIFLKLTEFTYSNLVDKDLNDNWIRIDRPFLEDKLGLKNLIGQNQESQTGGKIAEGLLTHPPFELGDKVPPDKVRGINTYHYKFVVDGNNLEKVFNLNDDSFMDKVEFGEGNLWIGKRTNSVLRLKGIESINNIGSEGTLLNLTYDLTFYNFNNVPVINIPEIFMAIRK